MNTGTRTAAAIAAVIALMAAGIPATAAASAPSAPHAATAGTLAPAATAVTPAPGAAPAAQTAITVPAPHAATASPAATAWTPAPATYGVGTQKNLPITMTDGTVLKANVYSPTDPATGAPAVGPFPVILTITPYGKDLGESDAGLQSVGMGKDTFLIERGYIHVVVDARGTGASQGSWSFNQPQESADGAIVVQWTTQLPQSSGVVGMIGCSYVGISQLLLAGRIGPGSPLKAIMPIVPSSDFYADLAQGGSMTPLTLAAYSVANNAKSMQNAIQSNLPSATSAQDVADLLGLLVGHTAGFGSLPGADWILGGPQAYRTQYWEDRAPGLILPQVVANDVPVMIIGGYRDAFARSGPLLYAGLQNASVGRPSDAPMLADQVASPKFQLIEGPWYHQTVAGAGTVNPVPVNTLALQWFDHWLKGIDTGITDTTTPFRSYDLTANAWTETSTYPFAAATPTRFYLAPGKALTTTAPTTSGTDTIAWSNLPLCTPSISQYTLIGDDERARLTAGLPANPCNEDDRGTQVPLFASTYTTAPLASAQVIAGPISAHILAKVSSLESEWVIRVEDVAPDGTSYPLSRGVLMGSLRALDEGRTWRAADGTIIRPFHPLTAASAQNALPGSLQAYDIEVLGIHATIAAGHSIRVTVSSNDAPSVFPSVAQQLVLAGGVYQIKRGGSTASYVQIPLAAPGTLGTECLSEVFCPAQ